MCYWAPYSGQLRPKLARDPLRNHVKCTPELPSEGWAPETFGPHRLRVAPGPQIFPGKDELEQKTPLQLWLKL